MVDLRWRTTTFVGYPTGGESCLTCGVAHWVTVTRGAFWGFAGPWLAVPMFDIGGQDDYVVLMYFDRNGLPITFERWSELLGDDSYRRLGWDEPKPGIYVSTVWLGLNHGCDSNHPLIFETMVFNGPWNEECRRYVSPVEAACGHLDAVERIAAGLDPWMERARGW